MQTGSASATATISQHADAKFKALIPMAISTQWIRSTSAYDLMRSPAAKKADIQSEPAELRERYAVRQSAKAARWPAD
jgi:hypothetical protein